MDTPKKRILIIEDETFIRELYEDYFVKNNLEVLSAIDGQEGYEKALSSMPIDLILLDVMMPKSNGLEVLIKLKDENSLVKDVPVFMLTNMAQDSIIKECLKHGAEGYLIKSQLIPKQIVVEIQNFFAKRQ